jgi:hypothetical protein
MDMGAPKKEPAARVRRGISPISRRNTTVLTKEAMRQ